MLIVYGTQMFN